MLLRAYGPRKTNIGDVTDPVGITRSTFYRFFDSRADPYVAIHRDEFEMHREGYYEEIQEAVVPVLANGLTVEAADCRSRRDAFGTRRSSSHPVDRL